MDPLLWDGDGDGDGEEEKITASWLDGRILASDRDKRG
jgi:hypothetical protein